jgi:hypothetical protein
MKIEFKIFRVILFLVLSIPLFFFSIILINSEYKEYILYGSVVEVVIKDIDGYDGTGLAGGGIKYTFNDKKFDNEYFAYVQTQGGVNPNPKDADFMGIAELGDTVLVKIISKNQVKILEFNGLKINEAFSIWIKLWKWILILILFSIGLFLIYKVYTTIKTKTTYN